MVKGDKCWIIENGFNVTLVEIISITGNLILLKTEKGKTLRLPKHRLYKTKEDAEKTLPKKEPVIIKRHKTPYDYMM